MHKNVNTRHILILSRIVVIVPYSHKSSHLMDRLFKYLIQVQIILLCTSCSFIDPRQSRLHFPNEIVLHELSSFSHNLIKNETQIGFSYRKYLFLASVKIHKCGYTWFYHLVLHQRSIYYSLAYM
jgi:hypothetical protein